MSGESLQAVLEAGSVRSEALGLTYDFRNTLAPTKLTLADVAAVWAHADGAAATFRAIHDTGEAATMSEPVCWSRLGARLEGSPRDLSGLEAWAREARQLDVVVSVGIGGSYLGNRVLRDALLGTRWNELPRMARGDVPELHFAGYHLDPAEARQLVDALRARVGAGGLRVGVLALSKSGTTTETLATTLALLQALDETDGVTRELTALTAPGSVLAALAETMNGTVLPFPEGIGGRFSVLSEVGLCTAAVSGVDVAALLEGAEACRRELLEAGADPAKNVALLYAVLHHLHGLRGRTVSVMMPYSERLKALSEWYVQLLAESLGKSTTRSGEVPEGVRTPLVAVGTTDMHAQTQLHQEGPHDKTVTLIDVADWGAGTSADRVPEVEAAGKLAGKTFAELNTLAREANAEALAGSGRPSDALVLDRLDARTLGGVLYLLMASVCYEGELLNVCTYDQPGVEAYKKIMKARL